MKVIIFVSLQRIGGGQFDQLVIIEIFHLFYSTKKFRVSQ